MRPSAVSRAPLSEARNLPPSSRRMRIALSMSPPAFSSAALHFIIGMSVRSRSSLTAAAEIWLLMAHRWLDGGMKVIRGLALPPSRERLLLCDRRRRRRVRGGRGAVGGAGRGGGGLHRPRADRRLLLRRQGGPA